MTTFYTRMAELAERLLESKGTDCTLSRYTNVPVDADDPGGAQYRAVSESTVTAAVLPMGDDDSKAFGPIALTGREKKLLIEPDADVQRGDQIAAGDGVTYKVEALAEVNPAGTRCLWKAVGVA